MIPVTAGENLHRILAGSGMTVSAAESCTGGMIGSEITSVPGSSEFFAGGVVSYSNGSKEKVLGVSHGTIDAYGAVSSQTASEMAAGARSLFGSDLSVAVTGIAGPGGGTSDKPVGLVYIAVCRECGTVVREFRFTGGRDEVRSSTVDAALSMLSEYAGML